MHTGSSFLSDRASTSSFGTCWRNVETWANVSGFGWSNHPAPSSELWIDVCLRWILAIRCRMDVSVPLSIKEQLSLPATLSQVFQWMEIVGGIGWIEELPLSLFVPLSFPSCMCFFFYSLSSLEQNPHHRLIVGLHSLLLQSPKNECEFLKWIWSLVHMTLLQTLLQSFELLFRVDPSLLISIYDNDLMNLLSSCFHDIQGSLITSSMIESLYSFVRTLILFDHTPDRMVIREYLTHVIFDPLLWEKLSSDLAIEFHDKLYTLFSTPYSGMILTSIVSIQVYFYSVSYW